MPFRYQSIFLNSLDERMEVKLNNIIKLDVSPKYLVWAPSQLRWELPRSL
jgi:hypothetical protein